ncbi:MAG: endonuclease/exonuclease/phosphatase family protein [Candidatus Pacebacteria bacterium]|nr:endonuclease/exonuclease/phosphatase family protein [Candidatus Paceibacterota bacterium]
MQNIQKIRKLLNKLFDYYNQQFPCKKHSFKKVFYSILIIVLAAISLFLFPEKSQQNISLCDEAQKSEIKVASFNIQVFGKTKREKEDVMQVLKKIVQEFDIVFIQELRDAKEETASYFLDEINKDFNFPKFAFIKSERLGRTSSKESCAYFYNTCQIEFLEKTDYVFSDIDDIFEREPYIASFRSNNFDFTLAGIHIKPTDAKAEIAYLDTVVNSILDKNPNEKDVIIMGDFNADGSYFNELNDFNPFKSLKYNWIITNDMDTMTKTGWTYDRIVLLGDTLNSEYILDSASVFYFDKEYGIFDFDFIIKISDHYPIYAIFRTDLNDDD